MMNRRRLLLAAGVSLPALASRPAVAQAGWPSKSIHFVVGFPPGGNIDSLARIVAKATGWWE
jgi:tripartite-type tricarboxylate transporter receptor subunit TctC